MRRTFLLSLLAVVFVLTTAPQHAFADPSPSITTVTQCEDPACDSGPAIASGSAAADRIRIDVSVSSSPFALDWLEVRARVDGGDWVCLKHWDVAGASSTTRSYEWNTKRWPGDQGDPPSGCASSPSHGELTTNRLHEIRAVARDANPTGGVSVSSAFFDVKLANAPRTPTWAAAPSIVRDDNGLPLVQLKWNANPETDIKEYHFIRTGPGPGVAYAVRASSPGKDGCSLSGGVYTCFDDDFPSAGYGGSYRYTLVAFRSSPVAGNTCYFGGSCVQSQASGEQSATVVEPSPTPAPTPSAGGTPTVQPSDEPTRSSSGSGSRSRRPSRVTSGRDFSEFYRGSFEESLPYQDRAGFLPGDAVDGEPLETDDTLAAASGPPSTGTERTLPMFLASGLLMVLVSLHLGRLLRDH